MTTAESLDVHDPAARRSPALVVLLGGPSGSGKSSLAARTGLPVLHLDDFYRAGDDPSLPLLPDGSVAPESLAPTLLELQKEGHDS